MAIDSLDGLYSLTRILSLSTLISFVLIPSVSIVYNLFLSPLRHIPGPKSFAATKWRLAWEDWQARRTRTIHALHQEHGPVVRIGPNEIHFNSPTALRAIYGPGSGFGRTNFYRMFDVYGRQNLFTIHSPQAHGERKKLLANAYSKSNILRGPVAEMLSTKIQDFLRLIEVQNGEAEEIFTSLHWYSIDSLTTFLFGPKHGGTSAMRGNAFHRALLTDILDPARRRLTWFAVHFPKLTKWLYTRVGLFEKVVAPLLPMGKPSTYTGIRAHALRAMQDSKVASKEDFELSSTIIGRLNKAVSGGIAQLDDLDIASECADHFLAGIDTTSDTLMFLIWALSLPNHAKYQQKIIEEARSVEACDLDANGNPTVEAVDKLPYLDAAIKETLRLYAPLPASEPRSSTVDAVIDGYAIPAGTVVSMSPYSLHRNQNVFTDPQTWNPERWLGDPMKVAEMKRWWWPFSSGGRMCIGMHLALAEMALVPAIYRKYQTKIKQGWEGVVPGITSRFEVFGDENYTRTEEHTCWIEFVDQ